MEYNSLVTWAKLLLNKSFRYNCVLFLFLSN
jgi:hypothetical protein